MLQIVDTQWKDHLYSLDHLKEGIGLRGYGQRDPLVEYKKESFELFQDMRSRIEDEMVRYLWWLRPVEGGPDGDAADRQRAGASRRAQRQPPLTYSDPSDVAVSRGFPPPAAPSGGSPRRRAAAAARRASAATTRRSRR